MSVKKDILKLRGNKCEVCGYSKTKRALVFARIFGVGENPSKELSKLSLETAMIRQKNFAVLCSNCNAELNDGLIEIERIDPIKKIYKLVDVSHITPAEILKDFKREKKPPEEIIIDV